MLIINSKQTGSSLVELMISMALGLASITAMASLVGHGIALNASLLAKSRLEEEINAVVTVISHDLKRAGYYALTKKMVESPTTEINPFDNSVSLGAFPGELPNSCISYAYDRNKNGIRDDSPSNENYGFRLRNNAIEIRLDGGTCSQGGWHDLTDPKVVQVTTLKFALEQYSLQQITQTRVNIELIARLKQYPDVIRNHSTSVLIDNLE